MLKFSDSILNRTGSTCTFSVVSCKVAKHTHIHISLSYTSTQYISIKSVLCCSKKCLYPSPWEGFWFEPPPPPPPPHYLHVSFRKFQVILLSIKKLAFKTPSLQNFNDLSWDIWIIYGLSQLCVSISINDLQVGQCANGLIFPLNMTSQTEWLSPLIFANL